MFFGKYALVGFWYNALTVVKIWDGVSDDVFEIPVVVSIVDDTWLPIKLCFVVDMVDVGVGTIDVLDRMLEEMVLCSSVVCITREIVVGELLFGDTVVDRSVSPLENAIVLSVGDEIIVVVLVIALVQLVINVVCVCA